MAKKKTARKKPAKKAPAKGKKPASKKKTARKKTGETRSSSSALPPTLAGALKKINPRVNLNIAEPRALFICECLDAGLRASDICDALSSMDVANDVFDDDRKWSFKPVKKTRAWETVKLVEDARLELMRMTDTYSIERSLVKFDGRMDRQYRRADKQGDAARAAWIAKEQLRVRAPKGIESVRGAGGKVPTLENVSFHEAKIMISMCAALMAKGVLPEKEDQV